MNYSKLTKPELIVELLRRDKDVKEMGRQVADSKTVNYSENALEMANEKIKELEEERRMQGETIIEQASIISEYSNRKEIEKINWDTQNRVSELSKIIKQKNETIIHLAQVQMEMERDSK